MRPDAEIPHAARLGVIGRRLPHPDSRAGSEGDALCASILRHRAVQCSACFHNRVSRVSLHRTRFDRIRTFFDRRRFLSDQIERLRPIDNNKRQIQIVFQDTFPSSAAETKIVDGAANRDESIALDANSWFRAAHR